MAMVSFAVMWTALLVLCVFFAVLCAPKKLRMAENAAADAAVASIPLCTVCGVVLVLFGFGCAGAMRAGAWCVLACAAAAAVWLAVRGLRCTDGSFFAGVRRCLCPAWLLAFGGSALLAVFLAVRQPLFTQWDEFSFWGSAAHVVWRHDALYTLVEVTNLEARTYPPALPLLGYAFSFLSDAFAPWLVYAAYGVMSFSVFGALVGALRNRAAAAFGALLCVLAPFAMESWSEGQTLVAYATAYADQMLGLLTAGACAVWLGAYPQREAMTGGRYASALAKTACVVAVLGLTKDVGLPLGLVVFLVCTLVHFACDLIPHRRDARAGLRLAGVALVLAGAAVLSYVLWAQHMAAELAMDRSEAGGSAGLSTGGMLVAGIRELLGVDRTAHFSAVLSAMVAALFGRRVSVFGAGIVTIAVIGAVLVLAFVLEQPGRRRRVVCFAVASGAGFVGYFFFQLICYAYVFSVQDGEGLVSYARYMGIYYLFWLLGAVHLLLSAAAGRSRGGVCVIASALALLLLCGAEIRVQDTLLGRGDAAWQTQTVIAQRARQAWAAADAVPGADKVLLVTQWDSGGRWYRYAYELEPLPLHHTELDNTIVPPDAEGAFTMRLDAQSIGGYLREQGITLLLLDVMDYDFWLEFEALFTDGMDGFEEGRCCVYRVEYTQNAPGVAFVPWEEAADA